MEVPGLDQKIIPRILSYKCVLQYLNDYFTYRKSEDSGFSYEAWSFELGFKSRAFLKMICTGKRTVTESFIGIFAKKMSFSEQERLHFTVLTKIQHEKSQKIKEIFKNNMYATLDLDQARTTLNDEFFLSSMYNPVIQMLIGFKDFVATEENMLNLLPLDTNELSRILENLKNLGLARIENGVWKSTIESFNVKHTDQNDFIKRFHQNTLIEAAQKLNHPDKDDQNRSIYFSVQKESMSELKNDIEEFLKRIRNKYGTYYLEEQQIVKLNLQLYGLTEIYKKSEH